MDQRKIAILSTVVIVALGTVGIGIAAWRLRQQGTEPPPAVETPSTNESSTSAATNTENPQPTVDAGSGATASGEVKTTIQTPKTPYVCDISVKEADCDLDGLTNGEEAIAKTDPYKEDTDGDGVLDGAEVHTYKSDPLNPKSIDPTMTDYEAIAAGKKDTRPRE